MTRRTIVRPAAALAVACLALLPSPARASITPISTSTELSLLARAASNGVFSGVAFDDKHHVYLRVWEHARQVYGLFIGEDGTIKGDVFAIGQALQSFAGAPRVAYSSGSSDDVFLVMFHSDYSRYDIGKTVFAQMIRYTGGGGSAAQFIAPPNPVPGTTNFALSAASLAPSFIQSTGDVVYNPTRRQFLVLWDDSRGGYDVMASLVNTAGGIVAADVNISAAPHAQGVPAAAYDAAHDRYLVIYQGLHPQSPTFPEFTGTWAKLISGADLSVIHAERPNYGLIEIMGGALALEVNAVYLPKRQAFLTFWTGFSGSRDVNGRLVPWNYGDAGADFLTNIYPIQAMSFNEGAADGEYNPSTDTVLMAAASDAKVLRGIELDANGSPTSGSYNLSTPVPANGSFFPKVAVGDGGRFAVAYITDYNTVWLERFQGAGGGPPPPPPPPASSPMIVLDVPRVNAQVPTKFQVGGWAIDTGAQDNSGVSAVHVWAFPAAGGPPIFVGPATMGVSRPDVGAYFGGRFTPSGFSLAGSLPPGTYDLRVYGYSTVAKSFNSSVAARIAVYATESRPLMYVDWPGPNQTIWRTFTISGWAIDLSGTGGVGVDAIHAWAYPLNGSAPLFVGAGVTGGYRPDVAAFAGNWQFMASGFTVAGSLPPGDYNLVVFAHSSVTGTFNNAKLLRIHVN